MFHFHKWSKWSNPIQTRGLFRNKQQWRFCLVCNKAIFRTLRRDKETRIEYITKALGDIDAKEIKPCKDTHKKLKD